MSDTLRVEYKAYVGRAWEAGQTPFCYEEWLEARIAALQSALEPFAAYGHLKIRYPDKAVFTLAYDRNGQAVTLLFSDFTHAAQLLPNAQARTTEATATGSAGGIAEIMETKP